MSSANLNKKRGFGFIEVLISSVILMLVLAEMLAGFAGGRLLSRRSRDRLIALGFARGKMEALLATDYNILAPTGEIEDRSFVASYPRLEFVVRTNARRYIRIEEFFYQGESCYKKITVVMKWNFLRPDVFYTESLTALYYNPLYKSVPPIDSLINLTPWTAPL